MTCELPDMYAPLLKNSLNYGPLFQPAIPLDLYGIYFELEDVEPLGISFEPSILERLRALSIVSIDIRALDDERGGNVDHLSRHLHRTLSWLLPSASRFTRARAKTTASKLTSSDFVVLRPGSAPASQPRLASQPRVPQIAKPLYPPDYLRATARDIVYLGAPELREIDLYETYPEAEDIEPLSIARGPLVMRIQAVSIVSIYIQTLDGACLPSIRRENRPVRLDGCGSWIPRKFPDIDHTNERGESRSSEGDDILVGSYLSFDSSYWQSQTLEAHVKQVHR